MNEVEVDLSNVCGRLCDAIEFARKEALRNPDGLLFSHAAVVFRGNEILAVGRNQLSPCSIAGDFRRHWFVDHTRHAEIDAVARIRKHHFEGCDIVVVRVTDGGQMVQSRPCSMCYPFLKHHNFRRIYYSIPSNRIMVMKNL